MYCVSVGLGSASSDVRDCGFMREGDLFGRMLGRVLVDKFQTSSHNPRTEYRRTCDDCKHRASN